MYEEQLTAFYVKAVTAISEGISVSKFTQFTYDMFQIPVIVADEGYQILDYAYGGSFADPYWEAIG